MGWACPLSCMHSGDPVGSLAPVPFLGTPYSTYPPTPTPISLLRPPFIAGSLALSFPPLQAHPVVLHTFLCFLLTFFPSTLFLFLFVCSFFLVLPSWCPHCFLLCLAASCDCHVMSRPSHPFMWAWLSRCRVCLWCHGCCLVRADVCVKVLSQSECVSCWGVGWAWNVWRCLRGEASVPHPPNFPVPATCACARVHFLSPLSALLHPSHLLLRSGLP